MTASRVLLVYTSVRLSVCLSLVTWKQKCVEKLKLMPKFPHNKGVTGTSLFNSKSKRQNHRAFKTFKK